MAFSKQYETLPRLDIAILNEGLSQPTYTRAEETGHEISFQVNYLSTALLALFLEAMDDPASFDSWEAYKTTKLLLLMFARELSKRIPSNEVIINVSNPGACRGTQFVHAKRSMLEEVVLYVASLVLGRTATIGARQYLDAVTVQSAESHGSFISEGKINAFPPIMYEQYGIALQNALWDETMREFAFVGCGKFLA